MKIYLYLQTKILTFTLPQKILGSFSFDEYTEEEAKLINIEARNSEWFMYSTSDVNIMDNGIAIQDVKLERDKFYLLKRGESEYLLYVTENFDSSFMPYRFDKNVNLVIGSDTSCNILYRNSLIKGVVARVGTRDGRLYVKSSANFVYLNNVNLPPLEIGYLIGSGGQLNIYGLKIMFLNDFLLINNPSGFVSCDFRSSGLSNYSIAPSEEMKTFEYRDRDLYTQNQYFSKSPRVRRLIKTKEVDLSPPPRQEGEKEMPLLLTVGPMITMGLVSGVSLVNNISKIMVGSATFKTSWPALISSVAMMSSILVWPTLTRKFNKKISDKKRNELIKKYTDYLDEKRVELKDEQRLQREILIENLLSVDECLKIIDSGKINFWDKRIEQNDFLVVRVGRGNELFDVDVNYPKEGFTIEEDDLRRASDKLVEEFKYIPDVPIGYSLYENRLTAFMGLHKKRYGLINNLILQLITFYSYEDVKLVVFTNVLNEDKWEYIKYLNHCFSNDKSMRFFSTNKESAHALADYLALELQNRLQSVQEGSQIFKPYYVIITDDYSQIKRHSFTKILTEIDANLGFSLLLIEERMSKLPSKCNNFISLGETNSGILKNSFDAQEQVTFKDEIDYTPDMMALARKLSNIPIEFEEGSRMLPDSITFLEMERVGKIEQLNIINRWDSNDATMSLRAEVGVDEEGNPMYLDLHEKYHGPHGLIAGMTESGKSEFIITYILSMAINYSPDDVAFILIDYKGGGLAFAFENKATGMVLPHLAGTITNLDKAEMDRTLVSIDSEIKRRQKIFNEARDKLGESTIDIYKYQRYYKEGRLSEPIPHLFIICDEFAELKSQQPDFMDNLISVARIGRSLGVHLILATQKPSGVVNDQIWSNTKFRVCLKVQDASDSKEMLKRPDAASLKQTGRFYLQVGYDEYFALGQSAWCGAKYYPSEKIVKQVDKSVNFIGDTGNVIKSIQAGNNIRIEADGEQLAAILKSIIEVSKSTGKKVKKLWLSDIDPVILVDNLEKKYEYSSGGNIDAILGEYDAPEKQEQGILTYRLNGGQNTVIFGTDEIEKENVLNTVIYSICKNHDANEVNIYAIDYGSEQLRMFSEFPQVGGLVFMGEDEKFKNLFKLINDEIKARKKMLVSYGGSVENYNSRNEKKLPRIVFILNNYEGILEVYNSIYEDISSIGRESSRYGITIFLTCNGPSTLGRRVGQCFENRYSMHLADPSDYYAVFNMKCRVKPREVEGRGLVYNGDIHEFQTASIVSPEENLHEYIEIFARKLNETSKYRAKPIPSLPLKVSFDLVKEDITNLTKVPIGISRERLKVVKYDFTAFSATTIASNKLANIDSFMVSLLDVLVRISSITIFFIDTLGTLKEAAKKSYNGKKVNYFDSNFDEILDKFIEIQKNPQYKEYTKLYIFYGLERLKSKATVSKIEALFKEIKENEKSYAIICDGAKSLKSLDFDTWYSKVKNNTDGIWVGRGFSEQQNFRISKLTKEMSALYPNDYGFYLSESSAELVKLLEFDDRLDKENDEDGE